MNEALIKLQRALPDWSIQRYGKTLLLACYPPNQLKNQVAWHQLRALAAIQGSCGPFYLVHSSDLGNRQSHQPVNPRNPRVEANCHLL